MALLPGAFLSLFSPGPLRFATWCGVLARRAGQGRRFLGRRLTELECSARVTAMRGLTGSLILNGASQIVLRCNRRGQRRDEPINPVAGLPGGLRRGTPSQDVRVAPIRTTACMPVQVF